MVKAFTTVLRVFRNYGLLVLGVYFGVALMVHLDVIMTEAAINPSDSRTWPEMGPVIRYYTVLPGFGTIIAIGAILFNSVAGYFHRRIFPPFIWFVLGVAYSLLSSFLALGHLIGKSSITLLVALMLAVGGVLTIRIFCGKKKNNGG